MPITRCNATVHINPCQQIWNELSLNRGKWEPSKGNPWADHICRWSGSARPASSDPSDPSAALLKQEQCVCKWQTTMFEPHQLLSIIRKCHCPLSNASNYPDHKFFKKSDSEAWSFEKALNTIGIPFWDLGAKQNVAAFLSADNVQRCFSLLLASSLVCHYIKLILLLIKHLKCSCIFFCPCDKMED